MKKIVITLNLCLLAIIMMAQVPAGFSYQAVVRNTSGDIVASKAVKFRFTILRNTETGTNIYQESQSVTTNAFGLANLKVGMGTKVSGTFDPAAWGDNPHFLKVELDPAGGSTFTELGTIQLLSVPYAFHAKTVEEDTWGNQVVASDVTLTGNGTNSSPLKIAQQSASTGQVLKWNGTNWLPENDNSGSSYWQQSGNDIYFNTGKVGIGKIPETDLRQFQVLTGHKLAVAAVNSSDTYPALYAENSGSGPAADFRNKIRILDGTHGAGKVLTSDGEGYTSWETPSGGGFTLPYIGSVISADPAFEVINNGEGHGIKVTTVTAPGIFSTTLSSTGRAILGLASATTGNNHGVYGISNSTTGRGVNGWATASTGMAVGVAGSTESNYGVGVYGLATQSTGTAIGVKGMVSSNTGYSGYFEGGKFYVSGNVGIGNTNPTYKLDVKADSRIQLTKTTGQWIAMRTEGTLLDFSFSGHNLVIKSENNDENILLNPASNNKVGIRTWTPQYDLDVNGNIRVMGEIYYGGSTTGTTTTKYNKPDYVFENKYKLFTIEEVEKYIEKENHLPWVTSAEKEKKENGDVVDMTRMAFETVETIENMQLQIIELNKQLKAMNKLIFHQQKEIEELKKMQ